MTKAELCIASAKSRLGDPYVFAARGEACTPANRKSYTRSEYPDIVNKCPVLSGRQASCTGCANEGRHIYDCRGFTYRVLRDVGISLNGAGATTQYKTDSNWQGKGLLSDMPDRVCCVFKHVGGMMSHTGLHIGGGQIIHCSGTVKTGKTTDAGWTHYALPRGLYEAENAKNEGGSAMETLKMGSSGQAVTDLQTQLTALGYNCGTADGIFGMKTLNAVMDFQKAQGLAVDGIAGTLTLTALTERVQSAECVVRSAEETSSATVEERLTALEKAVEELRGTVHSA